MKITVPPWRASRSTLMTRFIMRCVILCGSEGSSGAHPSPECSSARLRAASCRCARSSRSWENWPGSHSDSKGSSRAPEPSPLELADELVAIVRLYAPRRVDVNDRHRRQRRPSPPAALDVPQPPGARVDQAPYPQASLPVLPYPDEGTLRV